MKKNNLPIELVLGYCVMYVMLVGLYSLRCYLDLDIVYMIIGISLLLQVIIIFKLSSK